jgi:hypothetical protein
MFPFVFSENTACQRMATQGGLQGVGAFIPTAKVGLERPPKLAEQRRKAIPIML